LELNNEENTDLNLYLNNSYDDNQLINLNFSFYIKLQIEYSDNKKSESIYDLLQNQTMYTIRLKNTDKIVQYILFVCYNTKRQNDICALQNNEIQTKRKLIFLYQKYTIYYIFSFYSY